jgi:site-specific DNA recombinase
MRVALYVRVSTQHQTHTQTIDQQLDRLRAYVQTQGWLLADDLIFRDDGFSGASLHRPGLERLREQVAAGALDRLLLTAPDRLARNYAHQVLLLDEFAQAGCTVEFLDRPMSQDPHDQLVLQIRGAVAEYERSLIAERMRRGRQAKLRAGVLLPWTRPPYGYALDPDRPRDPAGVRLAPAAAAIVQEMFAYYIEASHSLCGLTKWLTRRGLPAPQGHTRWNQATVRGILGNPVYTGALYSNRCGSAPGRRRQSALAPVGHTGGHFIRPASEWVRIGDVPALVSQADFDAVQTKLAQNQRFAARNNSAHEYLLRALVSCGQCHLACMGRCDARRPAYAYYVCRGKAHPTQSCRDSKCPARFIPAAQLDELVWTDLCALVTHPEVIGAALQRAQSGEWLPQELAARRTNLQHAATEIAGQIERLTEAYLARVLELAEYKRRRGELEQRQASLEQQAQQLLAQVERQHEIVGLTTAATEFCTRVQTGVAQADFAARRAVVELLIDRVIVTGEEVEIRYVIPTSRRSEQVRFCYLRLDYFDLPAHTGQYDCLLHAQMLHRDVADVHIPARAG